MVSVFLDPAKWQNVAPDPAPYDDNFACNVNECGQMYRCMCRYLCVICYPGQLGCKRMEDDTACEARASQKKRARSKSKIKVD